MSDLAARLEPMTTFAWGLTDRSPPLPKPTRDRGSAAVSLRAGARSRVELGTAGGGDHARLLAALGALDDHQLSILGFERSTLALDLADLIEAREGLAIERIERQGSSQWRTDQLEDAH